MPFAIRPMDAADLPAAQALTAAIRWPHRVEDWRFVFDLGTGVVAESAGRVVATAMAWRLGAHWGATGMIIVAAACQGQGLGRRLMEAILPVLGARSVVLHATEAGAPLYRRLGFAAAGVVRQHQGIARPLGPPDARLRAAEAGDLDGLAALDAAATGMDRRPVLAALLDVAEGVVIERGGVACGFSFLRPFGRGRVMGPVVAPDAEAARDLTGHWIGRHGGAFLRIDVPVESGLSDWLDAQGMPAVDQALRMIRGAPPVARALRSVALVNQALG